MLGFNPLLSLCCHFALLQLLLGLDYSDRFPSFLEFLTNEMEDKLTHEQLQCAKVLDPPIKGRSDELIYEHIQLSNRLKALIIHDPAAELVSIF